MTISRYFILILIIIFQVTFLGEESSFAQGNDLGEIYNQGNQLIQAAKWAEAAEVYQKGIENYPQEAWLYVNLGWAYRHLEEYSKALEVTLKGYGLKPDDEKIALNLKGTYFDLGRYHIDDVDWNKAAEVYLSALVRFPDEAWFHVNLGWAYRHLKEYAKALEVTLKGYGLKPDDERIALNLKGVYFDLGQAHVDAEKWEEALSLYKQASQTFPDEAWFYVNTGWTYRNLKEFDKALRVTLRGYELSPEEKKIQDNLKGTYYDLGRLHVDVKEWEKAKDVYLEASDKFPDEAWFYGNLSWVYRNLAEVAESLEVSRTAHRLKGDDDKIKENLRSAYVALGEHYRYGEKNPSKSIPLYQEALQVLPKDPFLYDRLGWAYIASERREEALEGGYFEKSAQLYFEGRKAQQKIVLSLPFSGKWKVTQGNNGSFSHFGLGNFSWDFMKVDEDYRIHREVKGRELTNDDFYAFATEVVAPAPGVVIELADDVEDNAHGQWNYYSIGNYVKIDHGDGIVSGLYHLLKGSIVVKVGEVVERGQILGLVGNSGYTDAPHLHYGLFDEKGATIPTNFSDYVSWDEKDGERPMTVGVPQENEVVWQGN